ncbi:MAG: hypothetical protein RMK45_03590 [Armatimonadota bacterium]|nr:hypothetical protein [Armatimonadota bacterium]
MRTMALAIFWAALLSVGFTQVREVTVGNFFFRDAYSNTSETVIDVGTTVRWVWQAGAHTTTSPSNWNAPIDSRPCCQSFERAFTQPGTYNYL